MIGTTLRYQARLTTATLVCGIMTVLILASSLLFLKEPETIGVLIAIALLPLCLTLSYWRHQLPTTVVEFQEDRLTSNLHTQAVIPYDSIHGVVQESRKDTYSTIHVLHEQGILTLPSQRLYAANKIMLFFVSLLNEHNFHQVPGELHPAVQKQVDKFGPEQVYVYTPRTKIIMRNAGRGFRALALGLIFTGLLWLVAGIVLGAIFRAEGYSAFFGIGMVTFLFGTLFYAMGASNATIRGGHVKWHQSGLLITPLGLALIQGKLRGEMKWAELKKLTFPSKAKAFESAQEARPGSISLEFNRNESVDIFDIYNHPLEVIHSRIKQYWQPVHNHNP